MRGFVRAVALVLAAAVVTATEAGAAQDPTVKGDPQAWAEVKAALGRLAALKTYRIKGTIRGGNTQAWEVVNPNRVHYTRRAGGGTIDTISVGKEMRIRDGATWKCPKIPIPIPDPNAEYGTGASDVAAHKGPIEAVGGVQTQTYTYTYHHRSSSLYLTEAPVLSTGRCLRALPALIPRLRVGGVKRKVV